MNKLELLTKLETHNDRILMNENWKHSEQLMLKIFHFLTLSVCILPILDLLWKTLSYLYFDIFLATIVIALYRILVYAVHVQQSRRNYLIKGLNITEIS